MFGNHWFRKEKPFLTLQGFGGAAGSNSHSSGGPSAQATGGLITEPGNGYVYHAFDGAADLYESPGADDTTFANFSIHAAGFSDRGKSGSADTAGSWCHVMDGRAQETVSVRSNNEDGENPNFTIDFGFCLIFP